jgi:antitoxin (DNA-binding transcriptional repressor) of toxin-antitoxin stability system
MMQMIPLHEAQARLLELFREAAAGGEVVILGDDGAAVQLVPVRVHEQPRFGSARGLFTMAEDFDAPLEDFAPYER